MLADKIYLDNMASIEFEKKGFSHRIFLRTCEGSKVPLNESDNLRRAESLDEAASLVGDLFSKKLEKIKNFDWSYWVDTTGLQDVYNPQQAREFSKQVLTKIREQGFEYHLYEGQDD